MDRALASRTLAAGLVGRFAERGAPGQGEARP